MITSWCCDDCSHHHGYQETYLMKLENISSCLHNSGCSPAACVDARKDAWTWQSGRSLNIDQTVLLLFFLGAPPRLISATVGLSSFEATHTLVNSRAQRRGACPLPRRCAVSHAASHWPVQMKGAVTEGNSPRESPLTNITFPVHCHSFNSEFSKRR